MTEKKRVLILVFKWVGGGQMAIQDINEVMLTTVKCEVCHVSHCNECVFMSKLRWRHLCNCQL